MTKKRDISEPRARLSPTATLTHVSEEFIEGLRIPPLPETIPQRLLEAVERRVQSLLFHLKEAKQRRYVRALEIRLVREAQRAVLTAYELKLPDAEVHYAAFRQLVEELGYERVEVGFAKPERPIAAEPSEA